jgi:L-serine deaminase
MVCNVQGILAPANNYNAMFIVVEHNMGMSCHYRMNLIKIETIVLFLNIYSFTL